MAISSGLPGTSPETVLLYGHCDKQPEMTGWAEGLGPWIPVRRGDRLYGRGAQDDGYAAFCALTAIEAVQQAGAPHARLVVLIEASEESGSPDLPAYMEAFAARIGEPDLVICLDSGCGNYEQLWGTTSLRGVINAVVPMIEPQGLAKSIALECHDNAGVVAAADHAKVEQILLNLLSNAVKFTPAGGRIDVGCASRDGRVTLSVADNGIGIAAEDLGAIFQPFVQVGRSLTSPHEGTGLGLAISSDLAAAMGGRLDVESAVGKGSTFTLTLPSWEATSA